MSYQWPIPSPLEEMQSAYSDFYKDMYGFRPALPKSIAACEAGIASLKNELARKAESFAGRMSLRYEGWNCPPESDPELAKQCAWLMAENEREMEEYYSGWAKPKPEAVPLPYEQYEVFA